MSTMDMDLSSFLITNEGTASLTVHYARNANKFKTLLQAIEYRDIQGPTNVSLDRLVKQGLLRAQTGHCLTEASAAIFL